MRAGVSSANFVAAAGVTLTVTHNLGMQPAAVLITPAGVALGTAISATADTFTTTTFRAILQTNGAAITVNLPFSWLASILL